MAEATFHDATVLDCGDCGGLFLPREVIDVLIGDEGRVLRLGFPWRERVPEPLPVRYLSCPLCAARMNRENFGTMSGVVVDVCKDDGVWFDAGELNAVITFVEHGGLARANEAKAAERSAEKARLAEAWRREHAAAERATLLGRRRLDPSDRELLRGLFRWLRR